MATLSQYQQIVRRLANDQTFARIDDFDLRDYINLARAQTAADGECVRTTGQAAVTPGLGYLTLASVPVEVQFSQALVARNATLNGVIVDIRPWDWFVHFSLNSPGPTPVMSHQGQGSFTDLWVSSLQGGALWLDVVALPVDLVDDNTPDAIPFPWVDAVAFYALWYAYMAQERQQEADNYLIRYRDMMRRGRGETTSTMMPENDPGGMGARIAAAKIALGVPPAPPAAAARRGAG